MRRICIFCGSKPGVRPLYREGARRLAECLLERGLGLVYGGASIGLMGEVAAAMVRGGGEVIGVIPQALVDKEVAYSQLEDLRVVSSMHERKAMMAELSDGFIALPGGLGTLEELFEILTWAQLGMHRKPAGILNLGGYYDPMLTFLQHTRDEGFISQWHMDLLLAEDEPAQLLQRFDAYAAPRTNQIIDSSQT